MTTMHAWKLRSDFNEKTVQNTPRTGKVRLDHDVPGLRSDSTREEMIKAIRTHNPDRSDKIGLASTSQIDALFNQIRKGNLARRPREKGRSMMIGEILFDRPWVTGTLLEVNARNKNMGAADSYRFIKRPRCRHESYPSNPPRTVLNGLKVGGYVTKCEIFGIWQT